MRVPSGLRIAAPELTVCSSAQRMSSRLDRLRPLPVTTRRIPHQPKREAALRYVLHVRIDVAVEGRACRDREVIEHEPRRSVLVAAQELVDGRDEKNDADEREEHREPDRPDGSVMIAGDDEADRERDGVAR